MDSIAEPRNDEPLTLHYMEAGRTLCGIWELPARGNWTTDRWVSRVEDQPLVTCRVCKVTLARRDRALTEALFGRN